MRKGLPKSEQVTVDRGRVVGGPGCGVEERRRDQHGHGKGTGTGPLVEGWMGMG